MRRDDVIRILQNHRDELIQQFGVKSLSLFGSVARREAQKTSDIDLLVEFDGRPISLFHLAGLHCFLADVLKTEHIDLVMRDSIYPALRESILGEAIDAVVAEVGASH
jgi:predicted nucleotidyltransferase